jgi:hypothetical protein
VLLEFPESDRTPRALELAAALVLKDGAYETAEELLACAAALRERLDVSSEQFERELVDESTQRIAAAAERNGHLPAPALSAVAMIERARALLTA